MSTAVLGLRTLSEFNILDTSEESNYSDLVSLATEICGAPVGLLSLKDENRFWFKARVGTELKEIEYEKSFCQYAQASMKPLIIEDCKRDEKYSGHPLVVGEPHIQFYAGFPLILNGTLNAGTLCILDYKARKLTALQHRTLEILAKQISCLLESRYNEAQRQQALETIENQKLQIIASNKMSALGEMAAGIAHEINNPLAAIVGYAGEIAYQSEQADGSKKIISQNAIQIENVSLKIAKIIKSLRSFARDGQQDPPENTPLKNILEDCFELCRERLLNENVKIITPEKVANITVNCRAVQISQVLVNLINNAFDAIQVLEDRWIKVDYKILNDKIQISVTDSGKGIPPEVQENLMKPFYTTKASGKGTGLGLNISSRIIQSHGGTFELDRACSNTRFVFTLPLK